MADGDRALRMMIAKLAEMPTGESAAVLSLLDDNQRERVRTLLNEYHGLSPSPRGLFSPIDRRGLPPGLSPWLVELLGERDLPAERNADSSLTPHTLDALRASAAELTPQSEAISGSTEKSRGIWQAVTDRISVRHSQAGVR